MLITLGYRSMTPERSLSDLHVWRRGSDFNQIGQNQSFEQTHWMNLTLGTLLIYHTSLSQNVFILYGHIKYWIRSERQSNWEKLELTRSNVLSEQVFLIECSPSMCHFVQSAIQTTGVLEEIGHNSMGLILVGGSTMSDVSINLNALAAKQQSIVGIPKGTLYQLRQLVDALAEGKLELPVYSVHKVEDASHVFEELAQCHLTGKAILQYSPTDSTCVVEKNS